MSPRMIAWRHVAAVGAVALLAACAQPAPQSVVSGNAMPVPSNPPPVAPGPEAVWYGVAFETNSYVIASNQQPVVGEVVSFLQSHPASVATIIGRTDSVGSNDYNMRLSHRRADAVRDALVYGGNIPAARVETRWTGEARQGVPTGDEVAANQNRVVDIAVH